jgi:hypothetical protein
MQQVESGRAAYRRIYDIFSERNCRAGDRSKGSNGEKADEIKCQ